MAAIRQFEKKALLRDGHRSLLEKKAMLRDSNPHNLWKQALLRNNYLRLPETKILWRKNPCQRVAPPYHGEESSVEGYSRHTTLEKSPAEEQANSFSGEVSLFGEATSLPWRRNPR
jgi:hypothetical protein